MKRIKWLAGLAAILLVFGGVIFYPLPSLWEWHSVFLKQSFFALFFCASFCLFRILRGPSAADRVVALNILGILIIGFCAILGIPADGGWYIDIGIAWALQSFISVLALGKYLEGRHFDE